ncbi:unnamed protein product [Boreogadus saida]
MHRRTGRRNSVTAVPINPHYGGRLAPFQRCADEPSPQGTPWPVEPVALRIAQCATADQPHPAPESNQSDSSQVRVNSRPQRDLEDGISGVKPCPGEFILSLTAAQRTPIHQTVITRVMTKRGGGGVSLISLCFHADMALGPRCVVWEVPSQNSMYVCDRGTEREGQDIIAL